MDLFPSDSVGIVKYEPLKALGRGSFGLVSLFRNKESKDLCVIKKIYAEDQTKQQLLNIRDEVRLLSALRHPNIVAYRETFIDQTDRNAICIVMDFCDGGDLDKRIRHAIELNYRFDENQIMSWITQLVMALEYLHKKNIIHRDLKSQNVFLMKNGMVKLGDFGVAKTISSTVLARTMVGTPYYLSPEVVKGDAYDFKADIWSLGCIFYELCTLNRPFQGDNMFQLMAIIQKSQYKPLDPQLFSAEIISLIEKLLQNDPTQRPSASEILVDPWVIDHTTRVAEELSASEQTTHSFDSKPGVPPKLGKRPVLKRTRTNSSQNLASQSPQHPSVSPQPSIAAQKPISLVTKPSLASQVYDDSRKGSLAALSGPANTNLSKLLAGSAPQVAKEPSKADLPGALDKKPARRFTGFSITGLMSSLGIGGSSDSAQQDQQETQTRQRSSSLQTKLWGRDKGHQQSTASSSLSSSSSPSLNPILLQASQKVKGILPPVRPEGSVSDGIEVVSEPKAKPLNEINPNRIISGAPMRRNSIIRPSELPSIVCSKHHEMHWQNSAQSVKLEQEDESHVYEYEEQNLHSFLTMVKRKFKDFFEPNADDNIENDTALDHRGSIVGRGQPTPRMQEQNAESSDETRRRTKSLQGHAPQIASSATTSQSSNPAPTESNQINFVDTYAPETSLPPIPQRHGSLAQSHSHTPRSDMANSTSVGRSSATSLLQRRSNPSSPRPPSPLLAPKADTSQSLSSRTSNSPIDLRKSPAPSYLSLGYSLSHSNSHSNTNVSALGHSIGSNFNYTNTPNPGTLVDLGSQKEQAAESIADFLPGYDANETKPMHSRPKGAAKRTSGVVLEALAPQQQIQAPEIIPSKESPRQGGSRFPSIRPNVKDAPPSPLLTSASSALPQNSDGQQPQYDVRLGDVIYDRPAKQGSVSHSPHPQNNSKSATSSTTSLAQSSRTHPTHSSLGDLPNAPNLAGAQPMARNSVPPLRSLPPPQQIQQSHHHLQQHPQHANMHQHLQPLQPLKHSDGV
eukprot:TRINITY_DN6527_c0_g1_i1.p1 TRINITY_DN6527_c0_g1~~TRINITY_DN6527_c0_g1_i1.p1  ORF type:complete len:1021 (-),score=183.21 TRINITY_DN6527_c0_g1_i1:528-3590(-)